MSRLLQMRTENMPESNRTHLQLNTWVFNRGYDKRQVLHIVDDAMV